MTEEEYLRVVSKINELETIVFGLTDRSDVHQRAHDIVESVLFTITLAGPQDRYCREAGDTAPPTSADTDKLDTVVEAISDNGEHEAFSHRVSDFWNGGHLKNGSTETETS